MQLLRHLTIRRVVIWIMILSLAVVALAGSYGAMTLREMYRHADRADALMQQLTFLTRAGLVMQDGTVADKAALLTAVPSVMAWGGYRAALSSPERYPAAARERLENLTLQLAADNAPVLAAVTGLKLSSSRRSWHSATAICWYISYARWQKSART
ncbi:hypothetical protein ACSST1_22205 [Pantoea agglomerans]|uniref:hypothetical protein n=1 Tax=Pantoea TaxID=53335 RepID=UPI000ABDFB1D|nr:hypothetical protein [Pantoea sp. CFSAN033090]